MPVVSASMKVCDSATGYDYINSCHAGCWGVTNFVLGACSPAALSSSSTTTTAVPLLSTTTSDAWPFASSSSSSTSTVQPASTSTVAPPQFTTSTTTSTSTPQPLTSSSTVASTNAAVPTVISVQQCRQSCSTQLSLVCGNGVTFNNPCYAQCSGVISYRSGECPSSTTSSTTSTSTSTSSPDPFFTDSPTNIGALPPTSPPPPPPPNSKTNGSSGIHMTNTDRNIVVGVLVAIMALIMIGACAIYQHTDRQDRTSARINKVKAQHILDDVRHGKANPGTIHTKANPMGTAFLNEVCATMIITQTPDSFAMPLLCSTSCQWFPPSYHIHYCNWCRHHNHHHHHHHHFISKNQVIFNILTHQPHEPTLGSCRFQAQDCCSQRN